MQLLVDVGNTKLKWATLVGKELSNTESIEHRSKRFANKLPQWTDLNNVSEVIISNVAGDRMAKYITRWCNNIWNIEPTYVVPEKNRYKVTVGYEDVLKFGIDRWLALLAAKRNTKLACFVVDCGTAVTIDVLSNRGHHLGGFILPGPELMQEILVKQTQIQKTVIETPPSSLLGNDTASCIAGGAYYSIVATIDRVVKDLQQELGLGIKLIMTGGSAEKIALLTEDDWDVRPNLVLEGLQVIAQGK